MKKLVCLLLAFASVGCMTACNSVAEMKLSYKEKYIFEEDINKPESEQKYYIFYKNGTGKYHHYYYHPSFDDAFDSVYSYTINFQYKIVEEENMVFCFYDGVEYDAVDTMKNADTTKIYKLMYTEDFLMYATNAEMYLTEDFVENELPNFGK